MSAETLHESTDALPASTVDLHRAIRSLMEELEAVDWYQQRVDATGDAELAAILGHNRDEEIEHAMMVLEWIRRRVPAFDVQARRYMFTEGPVTEQEAAVTAAHGVGGGAASDAGTPGSGELGIGSLKQGGGS